MYLLFAIWFILIYSDYLLAFLNSIFACYNQVRSEVLINLY